MLLNALTSNGCSSNKDSKKTLSTAELAYVNELIERYTNQYRSKERTIQKGCYI